MLLWHLLAIGGADKGGREAGSAAQEGTPAFVEVVVVVVVVVEEGGQGDGIGLY